MDTPLNSNQGHRERLRKRYAETGHDHFQDYEKIELLLTYALPRKDVKPLARELLKTMGGISGIFKATASELRNVKGIGESTVLLIMLMRGLFEDTLKQKIVGRPVAESSLEILEHARLKIGTLGKEAFLIYFLNSGNEILNCEVIAHGSIDRVMVHPRDVFESAIKYNANALVVVHNHPGGTAEPSQADMELTDSLNAMGKTLQIELLDHIIVTRDRAFSIKMNRRLESSGENAPELFVSDPPLEQAGQTASRYSTQKFHDERLLSLRRNSMVNLTAPRKKRGGK